MNNKINRQSVLVIVAHPDDEVLGCGGTIAKHTNSGDIVNVAILAQGIVSRYNSQDNNMEINQKILNIENAAQNANVVLGVKSLKFQNFPDNRMDSLDRLEVIKIVEALVDKFKPEIVYTHHVSDVNVDHCVVNQSVIAACRPQPGHCVKRTLFFEVASSSEWQPAASGFYFKPNWFVDITETLDLKLRALKFYECEMRKYPHSRSIEAVEYLARWRGASVGVRAAEAFVLARSLE